MTGRSVVPGWFDPDDDRTARVVWSRIAEPGDRDAGRLVADHGPAEALRQVIGGLRVPRSVHARGPADEAGSARQSRGDAAQGWRERLAVTDPARDLGTLHRFGGRLLVPGDPEWPGQLDDLDLRRPYCLWVRGRCDLAETCRSAVAVVGSRAVTRYGLDVTTELAGGLAATGVTVVSGAAFGVDAAAHRAALARGAPTVAVLAGGVDRPYPRAHDALIAQVVADGVLVSEVPPASAPTRWRFLERNRLIAALTRATVVVEAAYRSGALTTAREAEQLSRVVAAVPGPVTSAASAGCHRLLRDRAACCVTSARDVLELVAPLGSVEPRPPAVPRAVHDDLPEVDLRVLDALPLRRAAVEGSVALAAGIAAAELGPVLGRLELAGLAVRSGSGWRRAPEASR